MLRHEHCVVAQLDAIENLLEFPVQQTQTALYDALQNDQFFYRVRVKAANCLTQICNRLPDGLLSQSKSAMDFFKRRYGCNSDPRIPVLNNFVATSSNLQSYFLMLVRLLSG
jgi:transcription initiation factor TFIID subunit 2